LTVKGDRRNDPVGAAKKSNIPSDKGISFFWWLDRNNPADVAAQAMAWAMTIGGKG
jgi:hypothetical protein